MCSASIEITMIDTVYQRVNAGGDRHRFTWGGAVVCKHRVNIPYNIICIYDDIVRTNSAEQVPPLYVYIQLRL